MNHLYKILLSVSFIPLAFAMEESINQKTETAKKLNLYSADLWGQLSKMTDETEKRRLLDEKIERRRELNEKIKEAYNVGVDTASVQRVQFDRLGRETDEALIKWLNDAILPKKTMQEKVAEAKSLGVDTAFIDTWKGVKPYQDLIDWLNQRISRKKEIAEKRLEAGKVEVDLSPLDSWIKEVKRIDDQTDDQTDQQILKWLNDSIKSRIELKKSIEMQVEKADSEKLQKAKELGVKSFDFLNSLDKNSTQEQVNHLIDRQMELQTKINKALALIGEAKKLSVSSSNLSQLLTMNDKTKSVQIDIKTELQEKMIQAKKLSVDLSFLTSASSSSKNDRDIIKDLNKKIAFAQKIYDKVGEALRLGANIADINLLGDWKSYCTGTRPDWDVKPFMESLNRALDLQTQLNQQLSKATSDKVSKAREVKVDLTPPLKGLDSGSTQKDIDAWFDRKIELMGLENEVKKLGEVGTLGVDLTNLNKKKKSYSDKDLKDYFENKIKIKKLGDEAKGLGVDFTDLLSLIKRNSTIEDSDIIKWLEVKIQSKKNIQTQLDKADQSKVEKARVLDIKDFSFLDRLPNELSAQDVNNLLDAKIALREKINKAQDLDGDIRKAINTDFLKLKSELKDYLKDQDNQHTKKKFNEFLDKLIPLQEEIQKNIEKARSLGVSFVGLEEAENPAIRLKTWIELKERENKKKRLNKRPKKH